jgi:hypothetical protein
MMVVRAEVVRAEVTPAAAAPAPATREIEPNLQGRRATPETGDGATASSSSPSPASAPVDNPRPSDREARRQLAVDLPLSRSSLSAHAVGARDRFASAGRSARSGALDLRASSTILGQLHIDAAGVRASGLVVAIEARALHTDLPVVADDDRFYRAGASLGAFHLSSGRQLYWLQAGVFVAEQGQLFDDPQPRAYGLALARTPLSDATTLSYGLGYTFDFGRGLPLPFLGLGWRWSPSWRLDLLLPVMARVTWQVAPPLSLAFGTRAAGDIYRYRASDAAGGSVTRQLRIARLRAGASARWTVAPGVRLELELGAEGASIQDGVGSQRAGGGYLRTGLLLGGSGDGRADFNAAD